MGPRSPGLLLFAAACAAPSPGEDELIGWADSAYHDDATVGRYAASVESLEELLPAALHLPAAELRVEYYLAQAHLNASLQGPFLTEPAAAMVRGVEGVRSERPSTTAHLVALVYHASAAEALLEEHGGAEELAFVQGNLRLLKATTLARLGFFDAARRASERDPELESLEHFEALLPRYDLPPELAPWLAVLGFEAHRSDDELLAYRFALRAIEGDTRYGHALPAAQIARLERWILAGAGVRFVCPESGTPYVPGVRRSPRSGIPHEEYVTAPRAR